MALTGRPPTDLLPLIQDRFELVGEAVHIRKTGQPVSVPKRRGGTIYIAMLAGKKITLKYHRVKFALAHGWLPPTVDHADLDWGNHSLANLRAATRTENLRNRARWKRAQDLPRGVYREGTSERFYASVSIGGRHTRIGTYDSPEDASAVVERVLKGLHGEFYRDPSNPETH